MKSFSRFQMMALAVTVSSMLAVRVLRGAPAQPVAPAPLTITEFSLGSLPGSSRRMLPGMTAGVDGNLWFTEFIYDLDSESKSSRIGRVTPDGLVSMFPLPWGNAGPTHIVTGPDGNLWFTSGRPAIGRITPGGVVSEFAIPSGGAASGITNGPDGNLWFVGGRRVGRITIEGEVSEFTTPLDGGRDIAAGPDGKLYVTDPTSDINFTDPPRIASITTEGVAAFCRKCSIFDDMPFGITLGADGHLWFTGHFWGRIGRIWFDEDGPATSSRWSVPAGQDSYPRAIAGGPDGNIWFAEWAAGRIGRITPAGEMLDLAIPLPSADDYPEMIRPEAIAAGPDGNVWFTAGGINRIGRVNLGLGMRFTVTSTGDSTDKDLSDRVCTTGIVLPNGLLECTLRAAIQQANATTGKDTIAFSIAGKGVPSIRPAEPLPAVTDLVVIDGTTQPGTRKVELSGTALIPSNGAYPDWVMRSVGLNIEAGGTTVRGLVINRFMRAGLLLSGRGGNNIENNFIGTDVTGSRSQGNGVHSGGLPEFKDTGGILILNSPGNTIAGSSAKRNVIAGNVSVWPVFSDATPVPQTGVLIVGPGSTGNTVGGNYIGVGVSGSPLVGRDGWPTQAVGVLIRDAPANTIGGYSRNIISGHNEAGVVISGSGASGNVVQNNVIGASRPPSRPAGGWYGILIDDAPRNTIGSTIFGLGNLISGNNRGIQIQRAGSTGNVIQGNLIGTQADGKTPLGNAWSGISIVADASQTTIGGTALGARNVVAFTGSDSSGSSKLGGVGAGIVIASGTGNAVLGNSVFSNLRLGIDLTRSGASDGDGPDAIETFTDWGERPNNLQPAPELEWVVRQTGTDTITIKGTLWNSPGLNPYRVELFTSATCDSSGYGEAEQFLSAVKLTTVLGAMEFTHSLTSLGVDGLPAGASIGRFITATTTDANGNTSELSRCRLIQGPTNNEADGVSDEVEDGAPNSGDGNGDGIRDAGQQNVASLPTGLGQYVTVASSGATALSNVTVGALPTATPAGVRFPAGFLGFRVSAAGGATLVTLHFSSRPDANGYWNYGPTPDDRTPHWYPFTFDGTTGAELLADRVVLHFVDGARGDHDLTANGSIATQGGLGFGPSSNPTVDTDGDGMLDVWETRFGLDATSAADGSEDPDGDGRSNLDEFRQGTHPRGFHTRYLAEGTTAGFFTTRLALLNVGSAASQVLLRFLRADGTQAAHELSLGRLTRATVDAKTIAGMSSTDFSTVVESDEPVVVDRTMYWGGSQYGSHAESAVANPSITWYLAEGATHSGFNLFYLVQNPSASPAHLNVTFLTPAPAVPLVRTYTVPAGSRFNIWVNQITELASTDVSAVLSSENGIPIIVERAMYLDNAGQLFGAGHESAGITTPATTWFLAEGATGSYFDLFVLLANPSDADSTLAVTYLLPGGATVAKGYTVGARSRVTIWVDREDAQLADTAVSTTISSTNGVPIIAERSMWWPGGAGTWHESHNSPGSTTTGTKWALADGEVGGPAEMETYILIANTSDTNGAATVTLAFEDGTTAKKTFPLSARSRFNVAVRDEFPQADGKRFGAVVEATGSTPAGLVVERSMYSSADGVSWAAGSNALGVRLK